jgi:hypothetical protein
MTFILHFQTSQEKRSTKGLLSFHRVDDAVIRVYDEAGNMIESHGAGLTFGQVSNIDLPWHSRYNPILLIDATSRTCIEARSQPQ